MSKIYKFPNDGYDVIVCKKQDIIDCIDQNIVDKEVALAIVTQCEKDIADFITKGCWTGIPFIGNVRVPKSKLMEETPEQQAIIKEAKETLNSKQYIMFRRQLCQENSKQAKHNSYYKYVVSMAVNANRKLYKALCDIKGELFTRIYFYTTRYVEYISEYTINNEQQFDN